MSETGLRHAQDKMATAGVHQKAIDVFTHYYDQLERGVTGFISEDSIRPLEDPDLLESVPVSDEQAKAALARTVIIKLKGGLVRPWAWTRRSHCSQCETTSPSWTSSLIKYGLLGLGTT